VAQFLKELTEQERIHSYFTQDNGTAHTTKFYMTALEMYSAHS
jgi:hypothetical protein